MFLFHKIFVYQKALRLPRKRSHLANVTVEHISHMCPDSQVFFLYCENCKARRQTSERNATLVWTGEKERRRLRGKNDDGGGGAR